MKLDVYHVAAFTDRQFAGNPAAVVPLPSWIDESLMQNMAAEINLSETAFVVRSENEGISIRWFTPTTEVPLCGHATLASASVLREALGHTDWRVVIQSASGTLTVDYVDGCYVLDCPSNPPQAAPPPAGLERTLGCDTADCLLAKDFYLIVLKMEQQVARLSPDFSALHRQVESGVIVTAPGDRVDFVSRFFAPAIGIDEDPVTGAAHCVLTPYWSERLGKARLSARQISARGGDLRCEQAGDRVRLSGRAVAFSEGTITLGGR